MKVLARSGAWVCYGDPALQSAITSIDTLIADIQRFPQILKNDKRSVVLRGNLFARDVIAKQPIDKNRRRWSRLLSLVRDGEAMHSYKTLLRFSQCGIDSVQPLLMLEKRHLGMVVDSWLLYEFREGAAVTREDLPMVMALLQALHANGMRHEDPNFGNFLKDPQGRVFLIDCKGKPKRGRFSEYYDYQLLTERADNVGWQDVSEYVDVDRGSVAYKLTQGYAAYKRCRTRLKQRIRQRK